MKKLGLIAFLALAMQVTNGQTTISFSGGVKLIKSENNPTTLWYVDESPSHDNIYRDIEQIGNLSINLGIRFSDNETSKALKPFIEGQGYFGSINGISLNGGFFYSSANSKNFKVQPELGLVLGYCSKGVGDIQNNDVYIQVNNTRFQDYTNVSVALRNAYIGLKPGLNILFNLGNDQELGFGVNYQVSYKAGFVAFRGLDDNGTSVSETEYLSAENVWFTANGSRTDDNPYSPDGLEFKVFYSF